MNGTRKKFFAGAGLAFNEHIGLGFCNAGYQVFAEFNGGAAPYNTFKMFFFQKRRITDCPPFSAGIAEY